MELFVSLFFYRAVLLNTISQLLITFFFSLSQKQYPMSSNSHPMKLHFFVLLSSMSLPKSLSLTHKRWPKSITYLRQISWLRHSSSGIMNPIGIEVDMLIKYVVLTKSSWNILGKHVSSLMLLTLLFNVRFFLLVTSLCWRVFGTVFCTLIPWSS